MNLTRRTFLISASATLLAGCAAPTRQIGPVVTQREGHIYVDPKTIPQEYLDMYAAMPNEKFPVPAVDLTRIDPRYYRRFVDYQTSFPAGHLIVDTPNRHLYLTMPQGKAMRYGVGIGREGFTWSGDGHIARKAEWPTWTPPKEMIERQPDSAKYASGMPGGLENPLGARALYIYQGDRDTLYRLHGTNEPWSIGRAVSSGCVRLLNQDIIDLYSRVPVGTHLTVIQSAAEEQATLRSGDGITAPDDVTGQTANQTTYRANPNEEPTVLSQEADNMPGYDDRSATAGGIY